VCLCVINSLTTPGYALWNTNTPKANSFSGAAVSLNWDTHTHTPVPRTHLHTELTFDTKSHTFPIEKLPGVVCVWDYTLSPSSRSLVRLKHVKNVTELLGCYSQRNSFSTESTSWIRYITFVKYLILVRITPKWGQKHYISHSISTVYSTVRAFSTYFTCHGILLLFFSKMCTQYWIDTFTFSNLADAFIQSNLQMRTIEAINTNKRATICKLYDKSRLA